MASWIDFVDVIPIPAKLRQRVHMLIPRLLWVEPLWILLLMPFILLPNNFLVGILPPQISHSLLIFSLLAFWPLRLLSERRLMPETSINWWLALLFLCLPINLWVSMDRAGSWIELGYLLFGIALCIALINWHLTQKYPGLIILMMVLINLGLVAVQLFTFPQLPIYQPIFAALRTDMNGMWWEILNANAIAGHLVLLIPIVVAIALQRRRYPINQSDLGKLERNWFSAMCGLLAVLFLGALIPTQSRGAYLAILIALNLIIVLYWPRLWLPSVALWIIAIGSFYRFDLGTLWQQANYDYAELSMQGRWDIYSRSLYGVRDFPLTGIGPGMYRQVIPYLYPIQHTTVSQELPHAHNLFIQLALDHGILGLVFYLAILFNVFMLLANVLRNPNNVLVWSLAAGTAGSLIAMLIHGMVDATAWGNALGFIPWMLIALSILVDRQQKILLHSK